MRLFPGGGEASDGRGTLGGEAAAAHAAARETAGRADHLSSQLLEARAELQRQVRAAAERVAEVA